MKTMTHFLKCLMTALLAFVVVYAVFWMIGGLP